MTMMHRRRLLRGVATGTTLAGFGFGIGPSFGPSRASARQEPAVAVGSYAAEVDAGLAYLRRRAADQIPLTEALLGAIEGGDPEAAKAAYVAARPPYEEIEVLAASFPETDEAIDARPYAIDGGETSAAFVSVHRIEALLYRDGNPEAAWPFARGLIGSARRLEADLERRESFDAALSFAGMVALANEIAAKKISSEEETWSDQSLLIFHHNWLGIRSQYEPFAPAVRGADPGAAAAVDDAHAIAMATIAAYPPAAGGAFPPYSRVPLADRGRIVRASDDYRAALSRAATALGLL